jgi:hypothetical protein
LNEVLHGYLSLDGGWCDNVVASNKLTPITVLIVTWHLGANIDKGQNVAKKISGFRPDYSTAALAKPVVIPLHLALAQPRDTNHEASSHSHGHRHLSRTGAVHAPRLPDLSVGGLYREYPPAGIQQRLSGYCYSERGRPGHAGGRSVGLSDALWQALHPNEEISVSHAPVVTSMSDVRAKMYDKPLSNQSLHKIIIDIAHGWYSDIQISAFLTACAGNRLNGEEVVSLTGQ